MLQMQQFFEEKLNAMWLFYTVKDQLMNGTNEIVQKQRHTSNKKLSYKDLIQSKKDGKDQE